MDRSSSLALVLPMSIVIVAKCPIPGKSKTRLQPLLGEEGAVKLAKSMLSDTLVAISTHFPAQKKILLYAPATPHGLELMETIMEELTLFERFQARWDLLPMHSNLESSQLSEQLTDALVRVRRLHEGTVVFLGMDSPELPIDEIKAALDDTTQTAHLCPSDDGGYGMLALPPSVPTTIFEQVQWSHPLTALSQLKVLTDRNVPVKIGRLMHDMDEPTDVEGLVERIKRGYPSDTALSSSLYQSTTGNSQNATFPYTQATLREFGFL